MNPVERVLRGVDRWQQGSLPGLVMATRWPSAKGCQCRSDCQMASG